MRSPATAMLWELWRLTRRELLFLIALLITGGAILLTIGETVGEMSSLATLVLFGSSLICLNSPWTWTKKIDNGVGFLFNLGQKGVEVILDHLVECRLLGTGALVGSCRVFGGKRDALGSIIRKVLIVREGRKRPYKISIPYRMLSR